MTEYKKREKVTLCGSTKFKQLFEEYNRKLTMEGKIVLQPGCYAHFDKIEITDQEKIDLSAKEMFNKLLSINNNNYNFISFQNKIKILNENNQKHLFLQLNDDIKLIYNYEQNTSNIPNIIHYIFGLKEQTEEFQFVYYLSIYSNYLINNPNIIYFHYQYLPYGYWWEKIKPLLTLEKIIPPSEIYGNKIFHYAHQTDIIRLQKLILHGGIYLDIDTICLKSFEDLLNNDFVMGIQNNSDFTKPYG